MHYDVAAKRLMELGGPDILRHVAGVNVSNLDPLDELPQEQVALARNDFAAHCTLDDGMKVIVLLEFQTEWRKEKLLDMMVYAALRMRRHDLPVIQVMILFQPSHVAASRFTHGPLTLDIQLVKVWELPVEIFLDPAHPTLWPLAALAKDGLASATKVDKLLYHTPLPARERSDLLTIFAIFLGMRDRGLARHFIQNRRELMFESPVYDMIKEEGIEEGMEKGLQKGLELSRESLRGSILNVLQSRFGSPASSQIVSCLKTTTDIEKLADLYHTAHQCVSLGEFESVTTA